MRIVAQPIRNKEGNAAASNRSWDAYTYACVAKVSKLKGLNIIVIGSSLIISSDTEVVVDIFQTVVVLKHVHSNRLWHQLDLYDPCIIETVFLMQAKNWLQGLKI